MPETKPEGQPSLSPVSDRFQDTGGGWKYRDQVESEFAFTVEMLTMGEVNVPAIDAFLEDSSLGLWIPVDERGKPIAGFGKVGRDDFLELRHRALAAWRSGQADLSLAHMETLNAKLHNIGFKWAVRQKNRAAAAKVSQRNRDNASVPRAKIKNVDDESFLVADLCRQAITDAGPDATSTDIWPHFYSALEQAKFEPWQPDDDTIECADCTFTLGSFKTAISRLRGQLGLKPKRGRPRKVT